MAATKKVDRDAQARAFISDLHCRGWRSLQSWEDGGHRFEMLQRRENPGCPRIIVQIYPGGNGFEVWRQVTDSNSIADVTTATEAYGAA